MRGKGGGVGGVGMPLLYQAWTGNVGVGAKELEEEEDSVRVCVSLVELYVVAIDRANHHRERGRERSNHHARRDVLWGMWRIRRSSR
jgi:hypothetical protein